MTVIRVDRQILLDSTLREGDRSIFYAIMKINPSHFFYLLSIEWQAGIAVLERSLLRKELLKLGLARISVVSKPFLVL
ncbi:hypothetical protein TMM008_48940 [Pseudomonas sp. 008]|nr:hypothetical protein TMM008_48940 [Pseudomonas sp. 008]